MQAAHHVFHQRGASLNASLNVLRAKTTQPASTISIRAPSTHYSSTSILVDALPSTTTLNDPVPEFQFQVETDPQNYAEFIVQCAYFEQNYIHFLFDTFSNNPVPGLELMPQDIHDIVRNIVPPLELPKEEVVAESGKERETESLTLSSASSFHTVLESEVQAMSSL